MQWDNVSWLQACFVMSSVQSLSRVWLFETPWTAARQASLSITNSWSLLKLMSIESQTTNLKNIQETPTAQLQKNK